MRTLSLELSVQSCLLTEGAMVLSEMLITFPRPCLLIADEYLPWRKYCSLWHQAINLRTVKLDCALNELKCGKLVTNNTTVGMCHTAVVDYNYGLEQDEMKEH